MARYRGGWTFEREDEGTPGTYITVPQTKSVSGLGKTNNTIDASDWDDDDNEVTLAGRGAGQEITVTFNYDHNDTEQQFMITKVEGGENGNVQLIQAKGTTKTYQFNAAYIGWVITPEADDVNTLEVTLKISGGVTQV
jgi:hypothetical protein